MKRTSRRSEGEIRELVAGYEEGTQTRADYCAAHGLPVATLDYYRRRLRATEPGLVEIDVRGGQSTMGASSAIAVVLRNGRRVEIPWSGLAAVAGHGQPLRALLGWLEEA